MDVRHNLPEFAQSLVFVVLDKKTNRPKLDEFLDFITKTNISSQCSCPIINASTSGEGRRLAKKGGFKYCLFIPTGCIVGDLRMSLWRIDETRPERTGGQLFWFVALQEGDSWIRTRQKMSLYDQKIWWADPEADSQALDRALFHDWVTDALSPTQADFVAFAKRQREIFDTRVYFIDGEDPNFEMDPAQTSPTNFYGVPSSFKLEYMAYRYGFSEDTHVFYTDVSKPALKYRKTLIKNWDGTNYQAFAYEYMKANNMEWQLNWQDADERFAERSRIMFGVWDTPDEFAEFWRQFVSTVNFHFVHINMINDVDRMARMVYDDSVVWLSNVFDYFYASYAHEQKEINDSHQMLLDELATRERVTVYERWPKYVVPTP